MIQKIKGTKWHLVPISLLFGVLPLIMHLSYFKVDPIYQVALKTDAYPDWFFFYKGLFFILLTVIMLICLILGRKNYPICRDGYFKIYTLGGLTFILITIFSTYFSPYKDLAIIGGPTRYEGLGVMICYIMVIFYAYATFQEISDYKYIVIPFAFATVVQALTGFTQMIGRDFTQWKFIRDLIAPGEFEAWNYYSPGTEPWFPKTMPTWQGTLGNSNYSGSFISLALPLFIILLLRAKSKKQRLSLIFIVLLTIYVTFACRSRAGLLACMAVTLLFILTTLPAIPTYLKKLKQYFINHKKLSFFTACCTFIILIALFVATPVKQRLYYLIQDIKITFTPRQALTSQHQAYPTTEIFKDIQFSENKIKLISPSNTLFVNYENGNLNFRDGLGRKLFPVTNHEDNYRSFLLYQPPYIGYTFEQIVEEDTVRIRLYIDRNLWNTEFDQPICGFVINEEGQITWTDYINFEPLDIQQPETLGFKGKERLGSSRGYIWSRSLPLLRNHMLLGAGPDMFMLEFPYNDFWGKLEFMSTPSDCVDKPHNTYLQFWINQGFLAFLAFILICGTYIVHCLKLYGFKKEYNGEDLFGLAFMCAIVGYLVASFFNDTTLSVTPLFFALLGSGMAYNVIYTKNTKTLH